jgi:hypothetical protein
MALQAAALAAPVALLPLQPPAALQLQRPPAMQLRGARQAARRPAAWLCCLTASAHLHAMPSISELLQTQCQLQLGFLFQAASSDGCLGTRLSALHIPTQR